MDTNLNTVEARGRKKKKGNKRSQMLRMIMPHLSRANGEDLAEAIDKENPTQFKRVWDKIRKEIADKLAKDHKAHASADIESVAGNIRTKHGVLLLGRSTLAQVTFALACDGAAKFENSQGVEFQVTITGGNIRSATKLPVASLTAIVAPANNSLDKATLRVVKSELGVAFNDIAMQAMAIAESGGTGANSVY